MSVKTSQKIQHPISEHLRTTVSSGSKVTMEHFNMLQTMCSARKPPESLVWHIWNYNSKLRYSSGLVG